LADRQRPCRLPVRMGGVLFDVPMTLVLIAIVVVQQLIAVV
jgi:hypothetical protein